jgi:hypothetical protein
LKNHAILQLAARCALRHSQLYRQLYDCDKRGSLVDSEKQSVLPLDSDSSCTSLSVRLPCASEICGTLDERNEGRRVLHGRCVYIVRRAECRCVSKRVSSATLRLRLHRRSERLRERRQAELAPIGVCAWAGFANSTRPAAVEEAAFALDAN